MISVRDRLKEKAEAVDFHDAATFQVNSREEMLEKAGTIGVLATENEDIRSLREMIIYGIKGMAAYAEHAKTLGKRTLK